MERIEEIGFGGLKLIQKPEAFCYGVDAVVLADFACSAFPRFRKCVDLGTGTGVIPLIMSHKNKNAEFRGIDVQEGFVDMAGRSCLLNGLEHRISFHHGDVSKPDDDVFPAGSADMVVCNPPYFSRGGAIPGDNREKFIARHEASATVEDFIKTAAKLLEKKGHFCMVHRPSRLVDIFCCCRRHGLEPKDMRMVAPRQGRAPNIVLVHCVKGGGKELKLHNELYVYAADGADYSDEIQQIYERRQQG